MRSDFVKIISEMNELGRILVTMDEETQSEQMATIRSRINLLFFTGVEFRNTDKNGNDWYRIPLLEMVAPQEPVLKALEELLRKSRKTGEWIFNPNNGDFITTLIRKSKYKISCKYGFLKGTIPEPDNITIPQPDPDDKIDDAMNRVARLQTVAYIADLIIRQAWVKRRKHTDYHFEGFFTHDTVEDARKHNMEEIDKDYGKIVFPALCRKLLVFLMTGDFHHMNDVARNPVRAGIDLRQRNANVGKCYGLKSPKYYSVQYNTWIDSIKPAIV